MASSFDWNKFELLQPESSTLQDENESKVMHQQNISGNQSNSNKFDWTNLEETQPEEKEESFRQSIPRHAARTTSRIAETIAGMPGDIANFLKSMILSKPELLGPVGFLAKNIAPQKFENAIKGSNDMLGSIPKVGSEELKNVSEKSTNDYTKPKTENEKRSDEVFQDLTMLMLPVKGKLPNFAKSLGISVASQLSKEGVKMFGGGETAQELGKAATIFLGGLIRPKNAMDYAEGLYKKAESLLPEGAHVNANNLEKNLNSLVKTLEKGVETTDKRQVVKPSKELLSKIKDGKINVDELTSAKRDINKLRGDPETVKGAKKFLSSIGKSVDQAIDAYSPKNPNFVKEFKNANEAWGTIAQSKKVSNYIKNLSKTVKLGSGIGAVFEVNNIGVLPSALAAGAAYGSLKGSELLYRILKSPVLRTHYLDVVKSSIKENGPATIRSLKKLDDEMINLDFDKK